jgi:PKD repeat protein
MGLTRRQRRAMAVAIVALGCWSIPATAQRPPAPPTGTRIQDADALRRARAAAAAQQLKPSVSLTVSQRDLYVNEVVTVTLNPADFVARSPFVYTVDFDNGETVRIANQTPQVQRLYKKAGPYTISLTVSVPFGAEVFVPMPVVQNSVGVNVRTTTFSATPAVAAVGEPITFATPARPGDSRIRYRFTFADDTDSGWIPDVQATHAYTSPGAYTTSMEVGIFDDGENVSWDKSEPVSLQVADVTLDAPESLMSNEAGMFTVQFPGSDPALRYRVNFADGSTSEWDSSRTFRHAYAAARTYEPFGEIGRVTDAGVTRVAASARRSLAVAAAAVVIPNLPPDDSRDSGGSDWGWLPYVAIVLVAALLGYGAKQAFFVPRPTFTPHRGQTDSQIETPDGGIDLELEVRLHRELDAMQTTVSVPGGQLIADSEIV